MAGDWIKIEHALPDKPEVMDMARILQIDPDAVVGKLIRVWTWFDVHTVDGNANVTVRALLNRYTGVTNFVTAMQEVGWMQESDGFLTVTRFDRHNGETSKNRANTNRRVAKSRKCNGVSVTNVTPAALQKPLPEKRREEKNKKEEQQVAIVLPFESDAFQSAWNDWLNHKAEIKQKMPSTTIKAQLNKCRKWGEVKSIAAIENAIAGKWQGLFEPKDDKSPATRPLFDQPSYNKNPNGITSRPLFD